jgi:hypothetical protein
MIRLRKQGEQYTSTMHGTTFQEILVKRIAEGAEGHLFK